LSPQAAWGIVLALVTAFFIGLFMVPRRYAKSDTVTFLVGMTAGACVGSAIYWLLSGAPTKVFWGTWAAMLPGANWALGSYAYAWGTERIGLAKATGIKNTQVVVTTLGGFLMFNNAANTEPVLACVGSAFVVATALALSAIDHREESIPHASLMGYLVPIIASVLYGVNGLIMNWVIDSGISLPQMNVMTGIGSVSCAMIIYVVAKKRANIFADCGLRDHALALLGGVIWAAGLISMILSIAYAGLAVAWSLMNLSVVVGVLYGVLILREMDLKSRRWHVAAGLLLACLGIAALYFAKRVPPDSLLHFAKHPLTAATYLVSFFRHAVAG
jgi:glucose uptake protein GlcU